MNAMIEALFTAIIWSIQVDSLAQWLKHWSCTRAARDSLHLLRHNVVRVCCLFTPYTILVFYLCIIVFRQIETSLIDLMEIPQLHESISDLRVVGSN